MPDCYLKLSLLWRLLRMPTVGQNTHFESRSNRTLSKYDSAKLRSGCYIYVIISAIMIFCVFLIHLLSVAEFFFTIYGIRCIYTTNFFYRISYRKYERLTLDCFFLKNNDILSRYYVPKIFLLDAYF